MQDNLFLMLKACMLEAHIPCFRDTQLVMFDKKLKVEKVELVKKVIRQNNYSHFEKSHEECLDLGINVNRPALDNFAKKLKQLDLAQKPQLDYEAPLQDTSSGNLVDYFDRVRGVTTAQAAPFNSVELDGMTHQEAQERREAITFELGELKIKEHALLQELSHLSSKFDSY